MKVIDAQTFVILHFLKGVIHLDIGISVVSVLDLALLPEKRICFIEEQ